MPPKDSDLDRLPDKHEYIVLCPHCRTTELMSRGNDFKPIYKDREGYLMFECRTCGNIFKNSPIQMMFWSKFAMPLYLALAGMLLVAVVWAVRTWLR